MTHESSHDRPGWSYPAAHRADVTDDFHGTTVADPYRWLEDDGSAATQSWLAAQRALATDYLERLPQREGFRRRLRRLWDHPRRGAPERRGDWHYYQHNDGLQDQAVLYRRHERGGEAEVVLDPNELSRDGTTALTTTSLSDDGRLLAYNLARSGSDWQHIHLLDLETGTQLPDVLAWCKFTEAAWLPDGSGFYYARYPAPDEVPRTPPSTHQRVYHHRLGTPQSADTLVYARPDAPNLGFQPSLTDDGRYLLLHVWDGSDSRNRVYYAESLDGAFGDAPDFVRLLDEHDARYEVIGNDGPVFYLQTDFEAPNGRIVAIDLRVPARAQWREVVPEGPDAIDFSRMVADRIVVTYLHHAHHQVRVFERDGTPAAAVPLPAPGTVTELTGRRRDEALFIQFSSVLHPPTVLRYDLASATLTTWHQPRLELDASAFETHQVFATSPDGTRLPLFVTHRRGFARDGRRPTLLYGYGGFDVNLTPVFNPARLAWLEQGGVYVQAVLRGGGEYGQAWHQAGMLANKQRVFDDFIAAAEWLGDNGYARPQHLAIEGRSNGGLLVAACMTQRPELFGAVHCGVPVIDMLRYQRFTAGRYWVAEYGDAEADPAQFATLLAYSPLHNLRPGTSYPATLITTADSDDRVVPLHARKFAAALQAADSGRNPILLRVETKAGHGLGKPTRKLIDEASDVLAFLWEELTRSAA